MLQLNRTARKSCVVFSIVAAGSRRILKYDAAGFSRFDPRGRQDRADELVVRHVRGDLVANPLAERDRALDAQELAIDLEQVGPLVRPVLDEFGAADQLVDQLVALDPAVARVGQERPDVSAGGRQAGQVEVDAAEELGVGAEPDGWILIRFHLPATSSSILS